MKQSEESQKINKEEVIEEDKKEEVPAISIS